MKVLLAVMPAAAEMSGPGTRANVLAAELLEHGHEVAICAADDDNARIFQGCRRFPLNVPSPLGLPRFIGIHAFPMANKLEIARHKTVASFEDVLFLTGALSKRYLKTSVTQLEAAINSFKPDVVYSEFNLSAIIAAKEQALPLAVSHSFPTQASYASNPARSMALRSFLEERGLPHVTSALELFEWADLRVIPSIPALEPVTGRNVLFCGPFSPIEARRTDSQEQPNSQNSARVPNHPEHRRVVAYVGNGGLSPKRLYATLHQMSQNTGAEVFLASASLDKEEGNLFHVAPRFDFSRLLPRATLFLNHGGQNSIMDGIACGVPQLCVPGHVFERRFNAESVKQNGCAMIVEDKDLNVGALEHALYVMETDNTYHKRALALRDELAKYDGVHTVVNKMETLSQARRAF